MVATDLVPREVAEAWLKYLREELPTVAFKCSVQKQAANISQRRLGGARMTGKGRRQKRDEPAGVDSAAGADRSNAIYGQMVLGWPATMRCCVSIKECSRDQKTSNYDEIVYRKCAISHGRRCIVQLQLL